MTWHPYGSHAFALTFAPSASASPLPPAFTRQALALLHALPIPSLREWIPGLTSIVAEFNPGSTPDLPRAAQLATDALQSLPPPHLAPTPPTLPPPVSIGVWFNGPDLPRVAAQSRLSTTEAIQLYTAPVYQVLSLGFAPGFPYLAGLPAPLQCPRLETPRPAVPAGSLAIGGSLTGIYSVPNPGGWNLIGIADLPLFSPGPNASSDTFALKPGDSIRFHQRSDPRPEPPTIQRSIPAPPQMPPTLEILDPGLGVTFQDAGRPGWRSFGIPPGGAMDPLAATWANRLVHNSPQATVLELCLQGQRFKALQPCVLSLTGPDPVAEIISAISHRRIPAPPWHTLQLNVGDQLCFSHSRSGVFSYLAIHGGFAAPKIFGSCSTSHRATLGSPLRAGETLSAIPSPQSTPPLPALARRFVSPSNIPTHATRLRIPIWPAPETTLLDPALLLNLPSFEFAVSSRSDRIGYRLTGPTLAAPKVSLLSNPVLTGTIQLPPDGQLIVTLPDGPTVGGYPRIGWIAPAHLGRLAQLQPGNKISFDWAAQPSC